MPVNKGRTSDSTASFLETTELFSRPFSVLQPYGEAQLCGGEDTLATAILPVQTNACTPGDDASPSSRKRKNHAPCQV